MLLDADDSQLVLIDYQEKLMPAIFEGPQVLANAVKLAKIANMMQVPVWATEQNPSRLGPNAPDLRALCNRTFAKMSFSAAEEGPIDAGNDEAESDMRAPGLRAACRARVKPARVRRPSSLQDAKPMFA